MQYIENLLDFIQSYSNAFLFFAGCGVFVVYWFQERRKQIEAACLIVSQIDELQDRIIEISDYIINGVLNSTAFYESLPLMTNNYWDKYKHLFVKKMDHNSYSILNKFYNYVSQIREQQLLTQSLQKNHFYITQNIISDIEKQFIILGLDRTQEVNNENFLSFMQSFIPQDTTDKIKNDWNFIINQLKGNNPNIEWNQFWNLYRNNQEKLITIINQKALAEYIPGQIGITLKKILKKYSMLEVIGCDGYRMLKKISKRRF